MTSVTVLVAASGSVTVLGLVSGGPGALGESTVGGVELRAGHDLMPAGCDTDIAVLKRHNAAVDGVHARVSSQRANATSA